MEAWQVLTIIVLAVCLHTTTQSTTSCKTTHKILKQCIKQGYIPDKIVGCTPREEKDSLDTAKCGDAEMKLYNMCGYRHCPEWQPVLNATDNAYVASDHDACTKIGLLAVKRGGSAVDAAISTLLCLGAVQPQSNGIGGGGFMLIHSGDEDSAINFRNTAPRAATQDMFVEDATESVYGGRAVSVPGEIAGHFAAHKKHGRLNWDELFTPTITMLREGIVVTAHMEMALGVVKHELIKDELARSVFFRDETDAESHVREGDTFYNLKLADTYAKIAKIGPKAFYKQNIAKNIVKATDKRNGILSIRDLKNYQPVEEEPMSVKYRSLDVLTTPSPSSGHVISLVLQLLDNFDISHNDTAAYNKILEAFRFGYAMRGYTGDKDFSEQTRWVIEKIRDGSWAREILSKHFKQNKDGMIVPYDTPQAYMDGGPIYGDHDSTHTTHVCVLGPDGDAVSVMSSVNTYFGSCVMTEDGIILNNEMNDFSIPGVVNEFGFPPAPENFIVPGKRAQSSASPLIALNDGGEVVFVSGAAGGSRIITSTTLSLIRAVDWGMGLEENSHAARVHDQLNMVTKYESWLPAKTVEELSELGYDMEAYPDNTVPSIVNTISKLKSYYEARGDPRKNGTGRGSTLGNIGHDWE